MREPADEVALKDTGRFDVPVLTVHLLALALALGPMILFVTAVAPAAFRVLPTRDMAGSLVAPVLSTACALGEGAMLVLFVTSSWLTRAGAPRLLRALLTRGALLGFFALLAVRQLLIPQIEKIRSEAPGLIDNLPLADPSRVLLDRYHRLSTGFTAAALAAALLVLVMTARLLAVRRAAPAPPAARPEVPKLLDLSD
ncbi:MAG TPA: hypothetical protein VIE39_07710 [Thermoanaerobaculia bacterium]